jgi:molecular chaperone IbpA
VFPLAEHIKVVGAQIENGILAVMLERIVPEELKPRVIEVVEIK